MAQEEEFDYMSDVFLQDVEPAQSLIKSRTVKRDIEISKRKAALDEEHRKKNRPIAQVEVSNRETGLSEPLCEQNKGFELLKKMGFQPGKGLGKSGEGRVDPVGLEIKGDRSGLGRETELKEKLEEVKACLGENRLAEGDLEEYRKRMVEESLQKQILSDLFNSQKICHQLDEAHGLSQPDEEWYWPAKPRDKTNDEEEEDSSEEINQPTASEKLKELTEYLRDVHYYCIWCGTRYRGEIDMSSQCPGDTRDQH